MPSARPSSFQGGGGILRKVDGTIVGLEFVKKEFKPKPGAVKKATDGDFVTLGAQLTVLPDGSEETVQPFALFVGNANDYEFEGATISGEKPLSKSSGWYIFLQSLVDANFPEDAFPDDPIVADYSALIGARVQFDWRVNEKVTAKYGKTVSKKDPKKTFDREDLIVTAYYGQAEATPAKGSKPAAKTAAKPAAKKAAAAAKPVVDIAAIGADKVLEAVAGAKDGKLTKSKLSVKILSLMAAADPETRNEVREWAFVDANLAGIEGVAYDEASQTLTLAAE